MVKGKEVGQLSEEVQGLHKMLLRFIDGVELLSKMKAVLN